MPDDRSDGVREFDRRDDLRADGRVPLHRLELARRQAARLVENVFRHRHLARVMEKRRRLETAQRVLVGDAELARERQGAVLHAPDMTRRHVVPRIDGGRQGVDRRDEHIQLRQVQGGAKASR
jgi:hypothetical protein